MEFVEGVPVTFREIAPNLNIPEKWKEVVLNTGGTHSTLQDIKLPQKAGGYWYEDSKKTNTRNRFIFWQTTPDAIELSEASLDVNLSGANLRCKVASGTPPLNNLSFYERNSQELVVLAATVSSVHRLIFPHPDTLDKKFGSITSTSPSVFYDTSLINNPNNFYILTQHTIPNTGVAHTCSSLLRDNGEAVFALAFGYGGEGGLLLVKLPTTGSAITMPLKRESAVPRFLSGLTGALRGKSGSDGIETYGVVLTNNLSVAICGDSCLRVWQIDEGGSPTVVSPPLSQTVDKPKPPPHGHMLQYTVGSDGGVILVAYLSFPNECEFVVMRMHNAGAGVVKFATICHIYGPQLDLLDYTIGYGDGNHVIWALWTQPDGDAVVTSAAVCGGARWRAVAARAAAPALPVLGSHAQYRDRVLAPGLFPPAVLNKALVIYRRTWGGGDSGPETDLSEACLNAVQTRLRNLTARSNNADQTHLMHKCWSDLYSWCMQYMEGLQKPLGLMVSKHTGRAACAAGGWWCALVRRAGVSLVRELEPLERMMLSPESTLADALSGVEGCGGAGSAGVSESAARVVVAGARWERALGAGAAELERRLFAAAAPQHRLLPRLLHLLLAPAPNNDNTQALTPQQIEEITSVLEPIKDIQNAVLELNDAIRLDVPEIDTTKDDEEDTSEYDNLFASDLGVSIVTETIRQMAEMRSRVVRGALCALGLARGAGDVPGAGHCAVHWQAYRALLWLRAANLAPTSPAGSELFRLKLTALGDVGGATGASPVSVGGGAAGAYCAGAGGRRARAHLAAARAPTSWHQALPLITYHLAHQLWAVSGGFEFGWWLASINQPRLVQSYVNMLEPWCEWNACSRQFILGLSLLELSECEGAYTSFCRAAKGVSTEPFLRALVATPSARLTQHQALVLYYMKVIKLFEIHDAGACVVRLAETAISIADKDDPNLAMFQWVVFKWHLAGGRVERALGAAAATAPHARAAAAAALLTTLGERRQLGALVRCGALAGEAERAAETRARLHDVPDNCYYDFLYALHISRHHYRKAAAVMYERAARCLAERGPPALRRRWLAAALTCLRLQPPDHAFLARPAPAATPNSAPQVIGPEELAAELRAEDPDMLDPVQQALLRTEKIDFDSLYNSLKEADCQTLLAITQKAINNGQFLPHWFLQKFMEVESAWCVRALTSGGRVVEAAQACCGALRASATRLPPPHPAPAAAPLALADRLLLEMREQPQRPPLGEAYEELKSTVEEYTKIVIRTSEDMKLAQMDCGVVN
ncbi:nuclear pore complex protein Nup160 homolog [Aricia agestis]|uniref:nuclear pore complex protein Nup160 homolog n=1 Tax=Aricia agestis TaxID=91739 RepID=UPI001C2085BB|nr:nuclear pore complex protein Nup160 homolog [Aricia agestis]